MNLAGLSAAYPGYQAAENTQATTEQNQAAAKEAALKLLGQHVLGRALTGAQPGEGQGPMPPQPGQASASSAPQGGVPTAPPTPSQGGTPGPGVNSAPAGATGMPEITLQALTQRILQTSPRVREHPEVLMAALERAAPLLDRQSKEDLFEIRRQFQAQNLATRERMVQMQQEGMNQRNAASTDARIYGADTSADARRYAADKGLEGRKYSADTILQARELSTEARRDIAVLSAATRKEIAERAEIGKTNRTELSTTARKEIATLNADTRREVVGMMEEGRERRADQTSADRRYGVDTRAASASEAEAGRSDRATQAEEGRMRRAEMSLETRQAMQRMSQAARHELEDARQSGADRRAELSAGTRRELASIGVEARKEITQFLEGGRNERAATAEQGRSDRAGTRNDLTARRLDQNDVREARLSAGAQVRQDQGWQRLENQKSLMAQRAIENGDKAALSQWRMLADAQHKLATEIISSSNANVNLKPAERKAMLAEQRSVYEAEIREMKDKIATGKGGSMSSPPATVQDAPPISMLKEGVPQEFKNGQTWTLENGVQKRLK